MGGSCTPTTAPRASPPPSQSTRRTTRDQPICRSVGGSQVREAAGHKLRGLHIDVAREVSEGRREPEDIAPAAHLVRASGQGQGQGQG